MRFALVLNAVAILVSVQASAAEFARAEYRLQGCERKCVVSSNLDADREARLCKAGLMQAISVARQGSRVILVPDQDAALAYIGKANSTPTDWTYNLGTHLLFPALSQDMTYTLTKNSLELVSRSGDERSSEKFTVVDDRTMIREVKAVRKSRSQAEGRITIREQSVCRFNRVK